MSLKDSTVLYYLFHFLYAGHPAAILGKLWVAYDIESADSAEQLVDCWIPRDQVDKPTSSESWKTFDDALKESWRATGVMAALIASAATALIATPYAPAHSATFVLLLASVTCSIISVSSATSFLSSTFYKPFYLKQAWDKHGLLFLIMLSTPTAWLSHALLTFQAALLSLAWLSNIVAVQIVITMLISLRFALGFAMEISFDGIEGALLGLLGARKELNHKTITPTKDAIRRRKDIRMQRQNRRAAHAKDAIPGEMAGDVEKPVEERGYSGSIPAITYSTIQLPPPHELMGPVDRSDSDITDKITDVRRLSSPLTRDDEL